jgi:hypothetical protein
MERTIAAISLQKPDRIPLDGSFRRDVWTSLEEHFRTDDAEEIQSQLGLGFRNCIAGPGEAFA